MADGPPPPAPVIPLSARLCDRSCSLRLRASASRRCASPRSPPWADWLLAGDGQLRAQSLQLGAQAGHLAGGGVPRHLGGGELVAQRGQLGGVVLAAGGGLAEPVAQVGGLGGAGITRGAEVGELGGELRARSASSSPRRPAPRRAPPAPGGARTRGAALLGL